MQTRRQFYVPNIAFWNWALISPAFVKLQLDRARLSYVETDNALAQLEDRIREARKGVWAKWNTATANDMWEFERQLKDIRAENKRISYVRLKLREAIDRMNSHLEGN